MCEKFQKGMDFIVKSKYCWTFSPILFRYSKLPFNKRSWKISEFQSTWLNMKCWSSVLKTTIFRRPNLKQFKVELSF